MQFRVTCLLLSVASGWRSVVWCLRSHCLLHLPGRVSTSFSGTSSLLFCRQRRSSRKVLRLLLRLWILCPSQVLLEKQHGDGNPLLGRGRTGAAAGEPDLAAAAQHCGGGHAALHAQLRAFPKHRAHRVHR